MHNKNRQQTRNPRSASEKQASANRMPYDTPFPFRPHPDSRIIDCRTPGGRQTERSETGHPAVRNEAVRETDSYVTATRNPQPTGRIIRAKLPGKAPETKRPSRPALRRNPLRSKHPRPKPAVPRAAPAQNLVIICWMLRRYSEGVCPFLRLKMRLKLEMLLNPES